MGKNKLSKFAEMEHFHHVFQMPSHALRHGRVFDLKGQWHAHFFNNTNPIVLELGCGKGEYTVELARRHPEKNFIGVDIKGARMWSGAKASAEANLNNVAFLRTDIEMISHFFAPNEVDEIWITFPDPQMKKTGKRLTATNFIQNYLQFLKPNAVMHLKTDSDFLYTYTTEMLKANAFEVLQLNTNVHASPCMDPALAIKTYYENQWLGRGLTIKYIQFKPALRNPFVEPDIEIEHDAYRSFGRSKRHGIDPDYLLLR